MSLGDVGVELLDSPATLSDILDIATSGASVPSSDSLALGPTLVLGGAVSGHVHRCVPDCPRAHPTSALEDALLDDALRDDAYD